ncbi:hypothetical protein EVG20_g2224 [Dentipellis fragilis]|uniref:DUF6535 domain-containing protein n=1 Tax=Dentipellis fragilis TaxID=205917 RepID=A0A4Y9ZAD6_9AGAM|nr:hypothetical protein EVG20_g2224 [Dentipellis fragilis]
MDRTPPPENTSKSVPLGDIEMGELVHDQDDVLDPAEELRRDAEYSEQTGQLWSNYVKLAEKRDKAVTTAWKDDMNGIIIFAGLYSAALTAFLVQSYQNLQENSADTSAALLKQAVFLLGQLSQQLSPNGSQVNISLPEPIPPFTVTSSSRRVNTLWFLSLILSLSAVLGATIVQQWAGYRMQVFHKLDNPIECSRIRQFLYEGTAAWKLNIFIETIPGLIHMALFLFFIGLADFLFSLDKAVASITSTLMLITTILYFASTGLPLLSPQSPYQTPLSNILWWLSRKARGGDKPGKSQLSTNMFDGRTQMAMAVSSGRSQRDARALRWFIRSPMDSTEFGLFISSIPATVDSVRGQWIWNNVAQMRTMSEGIPTSKIPRGLVVHPLDDLAGRLGRFLQSCIDQSVQDETTRRQRAHAGINAVLSLMFVGGFTWDTLTAGQWGFFLRSSTMTRTLIYLATVDTADSDLDGTSTARRVCMSIITASKILTHEDVRKQAKHALSCFDTPIRPDASAPLREHFLADIEAFWATGDLLKSKLIGHALSLKESQSPEATKRLNEEWEKDIAAVPIPETYSTDATGDQGIFWLVEIFVTLTQGLIRHIPGAIINISDLSVRRMKREHLISTHVISPDMLVCTLKLWVLLLQTGDTSSNELPPKALHPAMLFDADQGPRAWVPTQYALLQDLRDGGMIYGILLLVSAVQNIQPTTREAQALYINTFDAITSDWMKYRKCESAHICLVGLLLKYKGSSPFETHIPHFLFGSVVNLVGNVLSGTHCPHRDEAREFLIREVEAHKIFGKQMVTEECLRKLS